MIEGENAGRLELLVDEHCEVANAAADIRHPHVLLQPVALQDLALVPPGHLRLRAQDRNKTIVLQHSLAWIKGFVILLDVDVRADLPDDLKLARGPSHHARNDDPDLELRLHLASGSEDR